MTDSRKECGCTRIALIAFSPLMIQGYRQQRTEPDRGRRARSGGKAHIERQAADTMTILPDQAE